MNNEIFIEHEFDYKTIREYLLSEGYITNNLNYSDGIYTFNNCTKDGDTLIYKIIARMVDGQVDYMSEVVGLYVDDELNDWEI